MDPSWAKSWWPNEEVQATAWVAHKLSGTDISHAAAVLAQQLCAAAGQSVHLTLALADTRVRLTVRTEHPIDHVAIASWQEQAAGVAHRCGVAGERELWAELDRSTEESGAAS
ncbi:hypothetical protein [Streptacidiphilus neutrinimicus]|uniref:hypothetical protein n=1 Tax=Streptacidiphilus neutrinimicus TaxID=105420 RepID=UPI0005A7BE8B|nr:hypothetical protein [Streptacidiphilus neutrinimicus]